MARAVIWSPDARADLRAIEAYVALRSPMNAQRAIEKIRETAEKQRDFPYAARMIPEFQDPDRRETFVYQYRLMFRVESDCIYILRVVHGRRLLGNVPGSFEEPSQETYDAA
jgi:plasmid stabilization system protein ParE